MASTLGSTGERTFHDGSFADAGAALQYTLGGPRAFVAPYVSGEYVHTDLGNATEAGAGTFNPSYGAMRTNFGQFGASVKSSSP